MPAAKVNVAVVAQPPGAAVGREKSALEKASAIPVPAAVPVLCSVSVSAVLVVPSVTVPNANGPPVTLRTAVAAPVPLNSTAPGSKEVVSPVSGLGLPKKSVAG